MGAAANLGPAAAAQANAGAGFGLGLGLGPVMPPPRPAAGPGQPAVAWDNNLDPAANIARAMGAFAEAALGQQRQYDRHRLEEGYFGKSNKPTPELDVVTPPDRIFDFFQEFEVVALTNRWSHARARLELRGAMKKDAAHSTAGIPVGHDAPIVAPWQQLATEYLNALITPAEQAGLKSKIRLMKQNEKEALQAWKARLIKAYTYANR